jgi:hypothetical protein
MVQNKKMTIAPCYRNKLRHRLRQSGGGQIAELGPALFLLFLVVLFPMFDMVYLGGAWASGWYLNQTEAREVASAVPDTTNVPLQSNPTPACPAGVDVTPLLASGTTQPYINIDAKLAYWQSSGMSKFCSGNQTHLWIYYHSIANPNGLNAQPPIICDFSITTTTVAVRPLVVVPYFNQIVPGGVPGLSQDIAFLYSSTQVQEEQGIN